MLSIEFAACERFGIDPLIQLTRPRDARKALAGYHLGRNALDSMYAHDSRPKPKHNKPKPRR